MGARIPLSHRELDRPRDDAAGAIARLTDRIDRQDQEIHQLSGIIRQLRQQLDRERRANTLLRARLDRQRTRPRRRRPPAEQLSLTIQETGQ